MIQRILIYVAILLGLAGVCKWSFAAGQETLIAVGAKATGDHVKLIREGFNAELAKQQRMNTELYAADALKANTSCFGSEAAFNACFSLDWPTGGSMTWPVSDSAYYAARNGAWTSLAGVFAAQLGADDNYVTDAEKIKLGNLSGTNTGDQTTITGNAGTATALAANGTNCSAGQAPLGIDASGNAEGCWTPTSGSASAAVDVTVADSGNYWTATTVEGVLAEIGAFPSLAFDTDDFIETDSSGTTTVSQTVASGTVTIPATAVPANDCTLISVTATGVTTSHWPEVKLPARLSTVTGYGVSSAGSLRVDWYLTAGSINFDICNPTDTAITPTAQTWPWRVKK